MKTFVHVGLPPVELKEPERHFFIDVTETGKLSIWLANSDGTKTDCGCLFYISSEGILQICSFVNKGAAAEAGIQLVTGAKIKVVGAGE